MIVKLTTECLITEGGSLFQLVTLLVASTNRRSLSTPGLVSIGWV